MGRGRREEGGDEGSLVQEDLLVLQGKEEKKMWVLREIGDKMEYTKESGNVKYSAVVVRNLRWNGFNCVAKVIHYFYSSFINLIYLLEWRFC